MAVFLSALLLFSAAIPAHAAQQRDRTPTAHGIDVSHHQGVIDWDTAAKEIDFAILRCGYGSDLSSQDDRQWKANADACTRLGIPFGVYIYSYATTEEQAKSEAQHVLRLLEGYEPSLPVYLDLEDNSIAESCSKEDILRHATLFCGILEEAGYTVGIYANTYWWTTYLTSPEYDKWERWVARYASQTGYDKEYSMWQYTSSGSVAGISGNVDRDYWYGEFPPACAHSYVPTVLKKPTCTQEGIAVYTCQYCQDSYEEALPATGHSYLTETIVPTCTQGGYTIYRCSCGDSYEGDFTAALGHAWDEGTVTTPPTETESGVKTYLCTRCDLTMTVTIPAESTGCENCPTAHFTDVPAFDNWAHEGIDYAVRNGLMNGVSDTAFEPENSMTRAMLVTVLWRYAVEPLEGENSFTDVPAGQWYTEAVAWAAHNGIVGGVGDNRFDPNGNITREQMAAILFRFANLLGIDTGARADLGTFPDSGEVSAYAADAIKWAVAEGLLNGTQKESATYLDSQGNATRAQVATILMRFIENVAMSA